MQLNDKILMWIFHSAAPKRLFEGLLCLLIALLAGATHCVAQSTSSPQSEQISQYDVDIIVERDGTLDITERISVVAQGAQIKRGIYRDFPTRYQDNYRRNVVVDFSVTSAQRNGTPEPYHTKRLRNGVRVYLGEQNTMLSHGLHTYELRFKTNRQIGFFDSFDSLYFNAIGHGWAFPIQNATIRVYLPKEVGEQFLEIDAYTGRYGRTEKQFRSEKIGAGAVEFTLTQDLLPREGFTIVLRWPKGFVQGPRLYQKAWYFIRDNVLLLQALLFVLGITYYYVASWLLYGKDPKKGTIIPEYRLPEGITPAEAAYVHNMRFSTECLSAAISELAIDGALLIQEESKKDISFVARDPKPDDLRTDQEALLSSLTSENRALSLSQDNYKIFGDAKRLLQSLVEVQHLNTSFYSNTKFVVRGVLATIFFCVCSALTFLLFAPQSRQIPYMIGASAIAIILTPLYAYLIKLPTKAGRKLMDRIEGYKMYLETAEADLLNQNVEIEELSEKTYEHHLPYAIALGVEDVWRKKFETALKRQGVPPESYKPSFYVGGSNMNALRSSAFSSSFTSTIASSSTPPGSSSGGGGGGFSGGGGGGGGGGGW